MPSPTYAIAITLALSGILFGSGLFLLARGLPEARRRLAAWLWAVWVVAAIGLNVAMVMRIGVTSLGLVGIWLLLGALLGIRLLRIRRRATKHVIIPRGLEVPISKPVEEAMGELGIEGDAILASTAYDLSLDGGYASGLLIVTSERIVTFVTTETSAEVVTNLEISEIENIRAENLVGGGRLVLRRKGASGHPEIVVRYTNAQGRDFSQIAKKLNDHVAPPKPDAEDEKDENKELSFKEPDESKPKNCPRCGRHLEDNTQVCPACVNRGRVIFRLLGISMRYRKSILVLLFLMILTSAGALAPPYLSKYMIDEVLGDDEPPRTTWRWAGKLLSEAFPRLKYVLDDQIRVGPKEQTPLAWLSSAYARLSAIRGDTSVIWGWRTDRATMLAAIVLSLVGLLVIESFISMARGRLAVRVGGRVGTDLRARVFHHLQLLSLGYFDKQKTGALMSRTDNDTRELQFFLVEGVQQIVIMVLQLTGVAIILTVMSWRLAVWVLLPAPIIVAFSTGFWRIVIGRFRRLWEQVARLSAFLNDSISGVRVVKAFGQEERENLRFDERNEAVYEGMVHALTTWATLHPWLILAMRSSGIVVWYVGGLGVIHKELTLGLLFAYTAYLGMFLGPLFVLARINDWLTRAATAAERVFEVLDARPEVVELDDAQSAESLQGGVEIDNISFGYDKFKPVLKNFSLKVAPGEMIGLVGHSGAGKSTTINLICRLYDVDEGAILLDGVDVKKLKIADIRNQIGVVLQETYLFAGSIAENVAYARPEATRERILEAAAAANAHDFVMRMADGYDSEVGERGKKLSGGEKQRVAIARAILHDPRILILDEATSSVDSETEKQIQLAFERLVKNRTTFAIAHRLSTLRNAHRLVVLENGEPKEVGTHEELMAKRGIYHKLVQTQSAMSERMAVGG